MNKMICNFSRITWPMCILSVVMMVSLFVSPLALAEENCVQLLTSRCEVCHYKTRICQKVDSERSKKSWFASSEGTWKRTMKNMVKQGAKLNKAEEKILVECLSKPDPDVLAICNLK